MLSRLYNSFLLSMLISVILFKNEWLEMRVNLGWVFFGLVIALFFLTGTLKFFSSFFASLVSLIISCVGVFLLTGQEGISIIPASIIRDGIRQPHIKFTAINYALITIIFAGLVLTFILRKNHEH